MLTCPIFSKKLDPKTALTDTSARNETGNLPDRLNPVNQFQVQRSQQPAWVPIAINRCFPEQTLGVAINEGGPRSQNRNQWKVADLEMKAKERIDFSTQFNHKATQSKMIKQHDGCIFGIGNPNFNESTD